MARAHKINLLEKLERLKNSGAVTEDEYIKLRKEIIADEDTTEGEQEDDDAAIEENFEIAPYTLSKRLGCLNWVLAMVFGFLMGMVLLVIIKG
jgi:hypothetical protein